MFLSDPLYFVFLTVVFLLYYSFAPGAPRRALLLAAGYFFYFELSKFYILVLFFVTASTYFGAIALRSSKTKSPGLLFALILGVVMAPLLIFKYLAALLGLGSAALPLFNTWGTTISSLAAPIGISFFTFAALGYLIDVYLEVVEPERSPVRVALFLGLFPLVSAGPIERAGGLMPQLDLAHKFSAERSFAALRLIFIGLMLKLFFADVLQQHVNQVFAVPGSYPPLDQLFALIFYAFYVYADFAGYSLIAIGSAKLLGFEVRPNFRQPFLSATVPDFWRSWHMSLSSWVRDYLFSPLRMEWRRYPNAGMAAALMLSFLIIGLWHGARWCFLVFGAVHGVMVIVSTFTLARRDAFWKKINVPSRLVHLGRILLTFTLVLGTFVLFRASTLGEAMGIYQSIFSIHPLHEMTRGFEYISLHRSEPLALIFFPDFNDWWRVLAIILGDILVRQNLPLEKFPRFLQAAAYSLGFIVLLYKWTSDNVAEPFQYYKF